MQPPLALRSDRAATILLYSSPLRQRIKQSIDRLPHRRRQLLYFERRLHSPRVELRQLAVHAGAHTKQVIR